MPSCLDFGDAPIINAVIRFSAPRDLEAQEASYLRARALEGRVYDDDTLRKLPLVPPDHRHADEWIMRADSAQRLVAHFEQAERPLCLLDLGCGNGWMSHWLARIPDCAVLGMDVNRPELEQGARVFTDTPSLTFAFGDIFTADLPTAHFDAITLAAAAQYFPDLPSLFTRLFRLLRSDGAIHLLDTPFYTDAEANEARARTQSYYEALGVPERAQAYHHHTWSELAPYQPELLYDPRRLPVQLRRRMLGHLLSPFPWLLIRPT